MSSSSQSSNPGLQLAMMYCLQEVAQDKKLRKSYCAKVFHVRLRTTFELSQATSAELVL